MVTDGMLHRFAHLQALQAQLMLLIASLLLASATLLAALLFASPLLCVVNGTNVAQ
jgi:hypothetical protein